MAWEEPGQCVTPSNTPLTQGDITQIRHIRHQKSYMHRELYIIELHIYISDNDIKRTKLEEALFIHEVNWFR